MKGVLIWFVFHNTTYIKEFRHNISNFYDIAALLFVGNAIIKS